MSMEELQQANPGLDLSNWHNHGASDRDQGARPAAPRDSGQMNGEVSNDGQVNEGHSGSGQVDSRSVDAAPRASSALHAKAGNDADTGSLLNQAGKLQANGHQHFEGDITTCNDGTEWELTYEWQALCEVWVSCDLFPCQVDGRCIRETMQDINCPIWNQLSKPAQNYAYISAIILGWGFTLACVGKWLFKRALVALQRRRVPLIANEQEPEGQVDIIRRANESGDAQGEPMHPVSLENEEVYRDTTSPV